jgi:hypothetical protein
MNPSSARSSVVLPEPCSPLIANTLPVPTVADTPRTDAPIDMLCNSKIIKSLAKIQKSLEFCEKNLEKFCKFARKIKNYDENDKTTHDGRMGTTKHGTTHMAAQGHRLGTHAARNHCRLRRNGA